MKIYYENIKELRWKIFPAYLISALLLFFLYIAPGRAYNFYFFFIYLIILFWLLNDNSFSFKQSKKLQLYFTIYLIALSFLYSLIWHSKIPNYIDIKVHEKTLNTIKTFIPEDSSIYFFLGKGKPLLTPLIKSNYILKTPKGDSVQSYEAIKGIYQDNYIHPYEISENKDNTSYYIANIIAVQENSKIFPQIHYICPSIDNYAICKLPINIKLKHEDIFESKLIEKMTLYQILNFCPEKTTIYVDEKLKNEYEPMLNKYYTIKALTDFDKNNKNESDYYFTFFNETNPFKHPQNCLIVNMTFLLCKF